MKNLLAWCDDPQGATGYACQARNILTRLHKHFNVAVLGVNRVDEKPFDPYTDDRLPFKVYRAGINGSDPYGYNLIQHVGRSGCDVILIIGDVWTFRGSFGPWLEREMLRRPLKTIGYFSTEYPVSPDDSYLMSIIDYPMTHSRWGLGYDNGAGYDRQKEHMPRLSYAPDSVDGHTFYPLSEEQRAIDRASVGVSPDTFLITNINRNTSRKDLSATIRVFARIRREVPNARLYLHTAAIDTWQESNPIDLIALCRSLELSVGDSPNSDVSFPKNFTPAHGYPDGVLNRIYNVADVIVSTSVSEGFGVTPLEALFCGRPVLIPGHTGFSNLCETLQIDPVRSYTAMREVVASVPVHPIDEDDLVERLIDVYERKDKPEFRLATEEQSQLARATFDADVVFDKYWKPVVHDIYNRPKRNATLFAQHSSAGDVFLSTSCFDGLRKRHPGPLHYMTCQPYTRIVEADVDQAIPWQPSLVHEYDYVYKPHDDIVLRGNWGTGDVPLTDIYARCIGVAPTRPGVTLIPVSGLPEKYIVVHTTSHPYRTYENFHIVLDGCQIPIVQVGSLSDKRLNVEPLIDMRGTHFRESAYVIANAVGFIGIDSFPAHVAGAYGIPLVVVFGSGAARVTRPLTVGQPFAFLSPDYTRICPVGGPCFGNVQGCGAACINSHDPATIKHAVRNTILGAFVDPSNVLMKLLKETTPCQA